MYGLPCRLINAVEDLTLITTIAKKGDCTICKEKKVWTTERLAPHCAAAAVQVVRLTGRSSGVHCWKSQGTCVRGPVVDMMR